MLEPRRLAARAAAHRIASEQKWSLGDQVGYQVRFENRTGPSTRLQILTEGIFANRLQKDPELTNVGCLILDEFHERSSQTDVALAMAKELQELSRPDLKIIVMSATLETSRLSQFLGDCPIIQVPGLLHPVEQIWEREPQTLVTSPAFYKRVSDVVRDLLNGSRPSSGNILVFLPGAGEIANLRREIESFCSAKQVLVQELHGSLSLEKQSEVLQPSATRKIILATNIAESSLTVPGVATVVDTGLAKVLRQEGGSFARLSLSRISQFSATQRAGRAGREMKGFNYRLWNKQDEASMPEAEVAELLRTDLSDVILLLSKLGVTDAKNFTWFEKPSDRNIEAAKKMLIELGAVNENGQITSFGKQLVSWPAHPRIAALLEKSIELGCIELGSKVAALLTEKDFVEQGELQSFAHSDSDLIARLNLTEKRGVPEYIKRAQQQYFQLAKQQAPSSAPKPNDGILEELLLAGFKDRLAWRRRKQELRAKMITGEGVRLHESSLTKSASLFVCLDAAPPRGSNELVITSASPISPDLVKAKFAKDLKKIQRTEVDEESGQIFTEEYLALEELPLDFAKRRGASEQEAASILPQVVLKNWDSLISEQEAAKNWFERFSFAKQFITDIDWPDFDKEASLRIAEAVAMSEKNLAEVRKKDLLPYLSMVLTPEQKKILDTEAPVGFTIPSGRFVKVDYSSPAQPTIEARLQEFFGWMDSPLIAKGKVKVRVQLLGPNYRPVQITSDLKGFWSSSYQDVRKELRARYPKHDWPENPLMAVAKQKFK